MTPMSFRALVVREEAERFVRAVETRTLDDLPPGEVTVRVLYSALNYKDGLSASGHKGVTRSYPHTPGIDAAGVVVASSNPALPVGAEVIAGSYDLGMNTAGGFGQYVRVPAGWVAPLPAGMTLYQSMVLGSAGFTAALALQRLNEAGLTPDMGEVLVTGATGGVGTLAVALLAQQGYRCVAATGKPEQADLLRELGAIAVLPRSELQDNSGRPLLKARWAAVIDTVGGEILATAIRATQPNGWVAACGNAASAEVNLTVYPFILRGVSLLGIDSATYPLAARTALWQRLAGPWALTGLERITRVVGLDELNPELDRILRGAQVGHVVVDLWR